MRLSGKAPKMGNHRSLRMPFLPATKLEIGVPLNKGHKMTILMAEDKPSQTEKVNVPWANSEVGPRYKWDKLLEPVLW